MLKKPMNIAAAAVALTLAGCASAPQKPDPHNPQELLAFAGFRLKVAVVQNDKDQIAGIPQRELLRVVSSPQPLFIWVDAAGCSCYYVGDEVAFRRLEAMGWKSGSP
jgi:hypothetical protein